MSHVMTVALLAQANLRATLSGGASTISLWCAVKSHYQRSLARAPVVCFRTTETYRRAQTDVNASRQARPMTHDLLKSSLETLGYRVRSPHDMTQMCISDTPFETASHPGCRSQINAMTATVNASPNVHVVCWFHRGSCGKWATLSNKVALCFHAHCFQIAA